MKDPSNSDQVSWRQLIERLDDLGRQAQGQDERRRSKRYAYGRWVGLIEVYCHDTGGRRIWVQGRNLSREGFGFLHVRALGVHGGIVVMLKAIDGQVVPMDARIRRCLAVEEGIWEIGVEFTEPIEIERFITTSVDASESGT